MPLTAAPGSSNGKLLSRGATANPALASSIHGKPQNPSQESSTPPTEKMRMASILGWNFEPATKEGKPIAVWFNVVVNFKK